MDTVVTAGATSVGATTALSHAARLNTAIAANKALFMLYSFKMKINLIHYETVLPLNRVFS
jgi:hypothetical protein